MQIIPTLVKPEKDELLVSYLYRLCMVNDYNKRDYGWFFSTTGYDFGMSLKNLARQTNRDPYEMFFGMTLFCDLQLTKTRDEQIELVNDVFDLQKRSTEDLRYLLTPYFNQVYYCNDCAREDINEHGFKYIHRAHQITKGLCLKHHRKTHIATPKDFLNYSDAFFKEQTLPEISHYESGFTKLFLTYGLNISEERLIASYGDIMEHIESEFSPTSLVPIAPKLDDYLNEDALIDPSRRFIRQQALLDSTYAAYISGKDKGFSLRQYPRFVLALLAYTGRATSPFNAVEELLPYYKEEQSKRWYRLVMNCAKAGYELVSKKEAPLMLVKSLETGLVKPVSIFAIIDEKL